MNRFAIYGASGCCRSVLALFLQQLAIVVESYKLVFVDDGTLALALNVHRARAFA